jgi:hypothetical protein
MNTDRGKQFTLTVRLGHCTRYTENDVRGVSRSIQLSGPIINTGLKGDGQPQRGDEIDLSINENLSGQGGIGSFESLTYLTLNLLPAAFAEFWSASAAADGMARDIRINFHSVDPPYFEISKAYLVEHMPGDTNENPKRRRGRPHPVVAELRDMRRAVMGSWRSVVTTFAVIAAFAVAIQILAFGIRAIWHVLASP